MNEPDKKPGFTARKMLRRLIQKYGCLEAWIGHLVKERHISEGRVRRMGPRWGLNDEAIDGALLGLRRGPMGPLTIPGGLGRPKVISDPECRQTSLELALEYHGSKMAWAYYLKRRGLNERAIERIFVRAGLLLEEAEAALIEASSNRSDAARLFRLSRFRMMRWEGMSLLDYLRPMKEYGHPRWFVARHNLSLGFRWKELERALDKLYGPERPNEQGG